MTRKPLEDPKTGIHRAKTWEIAFYSLNNVSTNLYMMAFAYVTYFLTGFVGVGLVLAGSITTIMRIWDGVTDPFIGVIVDKTNGRFGKNRPFIIIGNLILAVFSGLIFHLVPNMPMVARFPGYIILYMLYIIGYTCQCCVTKSAQTCLTNDPEQRPVFSMFNIVFGTIVLSIFFPIMVTDYLLPRHGTAAEDFGDAFTNIGFFRELWLIVVVLSAFFAILAVIGLWRKDNSKYFGTGEIHKIGFRDYWDVLKNNRAIQMMIVATSTDKLAMTMVTNSTIMVMLYGIVCGNYANYSRVGALISTPQIVLTLLLYQFVARKMGLKKAMLVGTWGGVGCCLGLLALFILGDPTTLDLTGGPITMFTVIFFVLYLLWQSCVGVTSDLGITMTADCADYEVYRTGKYVPGLMGTLFSFVDKLISSLSSTFVAVMVAAIGFSEAPPTQSTPYSTPIFVVTMFCLLGAPLIGYICNVVAMKFYPLTKEKMEEIQEKIAEIKAKATSAQ